MQDLFWCTIRTISEVVENRKFFPPPSILRPTEGVPLELDSGALSQKTRMIELPGREISLAISSAVWIQYMNVTDRRAVCSRD